MKIMRVPIRWIVSCFVVSSLLSSAAFAQPGEDDGAGAPAEPPPPPPAAPVMMAPPPPPMPPAQPTAPASTVDKGIVEDANAGRSWIMPTALVEPAGTWSFSDFELLMVSLGYSVTDQLSISATTLLPITDKMPFFGLFNAKYQVIKSGRVRGAVQGAVSHIRVDGNGVSAAVLGGALTVCLDDECHSHATGYLGAGFAHENQSAVPFVFSGALAVRMNKHIKLLLEADSGFVAGDINDKINGFLAWYGVRFTSSIIGVDLGFAKPICTDGRDCNTGLPLGLPFVSFTYRALKD